MILKILNALVNSFRNMNSITNKQFRVNIIFIAYILPISVIQIATKCIKCIFFHRSFSSFQSKYAFPQIIAKIIIEEKIQRNKSI